MISMLDVNNEDKEGILMVLCIFENSRKETQYLRGENYDEKTSKDL